MLLFTRALLTSKFLLIKCAFLRSELLACIGQVDNCGSSKWIDLKPSLHAGEVICGLINEKKALENNIEGIESQLKVSEEKVHILQKQLERSKRKNNKIQTEVSQLEAKEKIYLRGIVALIGLVCVMLLLK